MTFSDPLLKELKGHIIALLGRDYQNNSYGDDNESVFSLCYCLESIFLKGLVRHDAFTARRADCFQWFDQAYRRYQETIPLVFKKSFEDVLMDKMTTTHIGKTRQLIRTCLRRKCLHIPLKFHVENKDFYDPTLRVNYRRDGSILGNEILSEIFLSLLLQMSTYDFLLDLTNSSFLDESWQVPALLKDIEIVPCDKLGLTLGFPMGYPVIVSIIENSAAAELGHRIEIGDILIEINGTCLRNQYGTKIDSIFRKCRLKPFRVTIIKGRNPKTSQVYLPIIKLYRILGLNPPGTDFVQDNPQDNILEGNSTGSEGKGEKNTVDQQEPILVDLDDGDSSLSGAPTHFDSLTLIDQPLMAPVQDDIPDLLSNSQQLIQGIENGEGSIIDLDKQEHESGGSGTKESSNGQKPAPVISKFYGEDDDQLIV